MFYKRNILSFLTFFVCLQLTYTQRIYVKPIANGNGSSWTNAISLSDALAVATPNSEIWVQQGIYYPTNCSNCTTEDRKKSLQIPSDVAIYGGFLGTETTRTERNWETNTTVLSGDINQDNLPTSNSYTIIHIQFASSNTILDGFTLKDANADLLQNGHGAIENSGGAIYNDGYNYPNGSNPIIRNCTFEHNTVLGFGGAIYNKGNLGKASPIIENCTFSNNTGDAGGGAIYNQGSNQGISSPTIIGCVFEDNFTNFDGGAINNVGINDGNSEAIIQNCTFNQNIANKHGGAIMNFGKTGTSNSNIFDCIFQGNRADIGGGIYNDGSFDGQSHSEIKQCSFTQNHGISAGGAIYNLASDNGNSNPIIENCIIKNNSADGAGAGIFNNAISGISNPIITNCIILSNTAGTYGGGIYNLGKSGDCSPQITNCVVAKNSGLSAGGMYCLGSQNGNSSPTVTNCTFYGNTAIVGGGIYCNASDATGTSSPLIRNTIIYGNNADFGSVFRCIKGTPTIENCLVDKSDCISLNSGEDSNVTCGQGVLFNISPLFVDVENNDFRLMPGSPLVDNGNNNAIGTTTVLYDLDGNIRISNNTVDIGAYEYTATEYIAPTFIVQPQNTSSCQTNPTFLSVFATGTPPLSYQWKKDGVAISGATNDTLYFDNPNINDSGLYSCSISGNLNENIESASAELNINPFVDASIEISSSANNICPGTLVDFQINPTYAGSTPTYEWIINGMTTGVTSPIFASSNLENGDIVGVIYNASGACVQNNPVISNAITFEVSEAAVASIEVEADQTVICANETVTFTVNTQNEGTNPSYQWQINGINMGSNNPIFSTSELENTDEVTCILISDADCVEENIVVSAPVSVSVNTLLTPEINIDVNANSICAGELLVFEANTVNTAGNIQYQWQINGMNVGSNSSSFESSSIQNNDVIQCTVTLNGSCLTTNEVISNDLVIHVADAAIPSIDIEADVINICQGSAISFTSNTQNAGQNPLYDWMINGVSTGISNASFSSSDLNDNDIITCQLVSSLHCVSNNAVTSAPILVSVSPNLTPNINITTDQNEVCYGSPMTFNATTINGGNNPSLDWYWNDNLVASNIATFTTSGLNDGDEIQCVLTSSESCVTTNTDHSNTIIPTIISPSEPSINVFSNDTELCVGAASIFEIDTVNAGQSPSFEWLVNGVSTGINTPTFTLETSSSGDAVQCVLQSDAFCLSTNIDTSESWIVQVVDSTMAEVAIDIANDTICEDQITVLQPIGINSGTNPSYLWFLNGQVVSNDSVLEVYDLENDDQIFVTMISSADCVANDVAISDVTTFTIVPPLFPVITINLDSLDTIFCPDDELVFRATTFNAGVNPTLEWFVNGIPLNFHESIYSSSDLDEGDVVSCQVMGTSTCVDTEAVSSNELIVSFESCVNATKNYSDSNFIQIYPNPSHGTVFMELDQYIQPKNIQIFYSDGTLVQQRYMELHSTQTLEFSGLSKGIYFVITTTKDNIKYTNRVIIL